MGKITSKAIRHDIWTKYNSGLTMKEIAESCNTDYRHVSEVLNDFIKTERVVKQREKEETERLPKVHVETIGGALSRGVDVAGQFWFHSTDPEFRALAKKLNFI